ncbi:MAG: hypothetical protein J2P49_07705 [Methylocapsa sp.]|nr:hypothetical protein [Methylocapsa sp.]
MNRTAIALGALALALASGLLGYGIARLMPPKDPWAAFHPVLGPPRQFVTYGPGIDSCGKMLSDVAEDGDSAKIVYLSWVLGYLSAAGVFAKNNTGFDANGVFAWVTNYCQAHPLDHINEAAFKLLLQKR